MFGRSPSRGITLRAVTKMEYFRGEIGKTSWTLLKMTKYASNFCDPLQNHHPLTVTP